MPYDEFGLSDEFKRDFAAGTLIPRAPVVGDFERTLTHVAASPFRAASAVGEGIMNLLGAPQRHPVDPSYVLPPAESLGGKASDLIAGNLLPVGLEIAGAGAISRAAMLGQAAKRPILNRALADALGFGLIGAQESPTLAAEQAAEGAGYGLLTALPRATRAVPAAALALGSKAFFDWEGGDAIAEGSPFTRGDVNAIAGFATAFLPGVPRTSQAKLPLQKVPTSQIPPSGPAVPLSLEYTPPTERPEYRRPGTETVDVPFEPALLPMGRADNRFVQITDFTAPQTEQQILNRIPARNQAINVTGPMAGPPTPGVVSPVTALPIEAQMFSPEFATVAKAAAGPLPIRGLDETLDAALRAREQRATVTNFMEATNPERDINPQKAKFAALPEYQRSQGGFITDEAAIQLAKAGGRGLIGAAFGGGTASMDGNPETDPATMAALGAAAMVFGPEIARQIMSRGQAIKRLASTAPVTETVKKLPNQIADSLGIEYGGVHLDSLWTFKDPVTGSNIGVPIGTDLDTIQRKILASRKDFQRPIITEAEIDAIIAGQKKITEPSDWLKEGLAERRAKGWDDKWPFVPADLQNQNFVDGIKSDPSISIKEKERILSFVPGNKEAGYVMPEMSQAMGRAVIGGLIGSFTGGSFDDPDSRQGMVMGGLVGAGAFMFGPSVARSTVRALGNMKVPTAPTGKPSITKDWTNVIKNLGHTIEERAGATISRGSTMAADRFARVLSRGLELNLPSSVKAALLQSKGLASMFLDQIDSAILKVSLRYNPDDVVKQIANQYLDGKIDGQVFLQQLQPHIATNSQVENYAKFMMAGREAVNGLQNMLVSGIGDPKLKRIITDSVGKYLTRSYRLFTDQHWNPDEGSIQRLIGEIHAKNAFGVGASTEDIENALRQYIREVKVNKGAYSISNFAAGTKINQQVLKERKDLSDAWKQFLGEITDPTERIYQTVFRLRPMAEASKYFESILKLEADGLPQAFRNYSEKEAFRNKLLQSLQNPAITEGEKDLITRKLTRLAAYQNVESHAKFGAIQGHIVSLPVWDTLQTFDSSTNTFSHPLMRSLSNAHTAIKLGRTAFNPMTVVRNMVTMPAFMTIARTNTKDLGEAWDVIHNAQHTLRPEILKQGIMNVDQVKTEFYKEFQNITGSRYNFGHVDLANLGLGRYDLDVAEKVGRRGIRGILDFYRLPDNVVRVGAYLSAKRRIAEALGKGMDDAEVIQKATDFTNRYTMNYDAVAPVIKTIRNVPFTNLFISYTAEMGRIAKNLLVDVVKGNGGDLAKHDRLYAAFPLATLAILPEMWQWQSESSLSEKDRRDWEKAKKLMPDYSRTRYRAGITRDKKTGQFHYIDFTPLIASDSFNQLVKAVSNGDMDAALAVNPLISWENTPALNIVAEQIAGKDKRTFREFRGSVDRVAAVAKEVLPPWMPGGAEWNRFRQAHQRTETGELGVTNLKTGVRVTPSEFWATYFGPLAGEMTVPGAKLGSVNLGVITQRAIQQTKNQVANETAYLNDVLKSDVNDEVKARAVERFKLAIATLQENFRSKLGVDAQ